MLKLYDHKSNTWPDGCKVDPGDADCPANQTVKFADFPHALAWFLWQNGYWPLAPSFACASANCPVKPASPAEPAFSPAQ